MGFVFRVFEDDIENTHIEYSSLAHFTQIATLSMSNTHFDIAIVILHAACMAGDTGRKQHR